MRTSRYLLTTGFFVSLALIAVPAAGQTFSAVEAYTTNAPAFADWQAAATLAGAISFETEDFNSYTSPDPDLDIPPGTSLVTPSGLEIAFDESADASAASRAEIDRINNSWANDPPFEGSASFEGFKIVKDGQNASGSNTILFIFPSPIIGFAGDFESATSGGDLTFIIDGNQVAALEPGLPGGVDGFFGYVHSSPFTTLEFGAENLNFAGEVFDIDNATWGVVPEPTAMFGWCLGVCLIGMARRESA